MKEKKIRKMLSLSADLLAEVERYVAERSASEPGVNWSLTTGIRVLLLKGLDAVRKEQR